MSDGAQQINPNSPPTRRCVSPTQPRRYIYVHTFPGLTVKLYLFVYDKEKHKASSEDFAKELTESQAQ